LDLSLLLRTCGILKTRHLATHLHVLGEFELAGFDEVGLGVRNWVPSIFQRCSDILVTKSDLLLQCLILVSSLSSELVIVDVELNPLARLLCEGRDASVELVLALAEDVNILRLCLFLVRFQLSLVHFFSEWLESATRLSHDYGSEDEVVVKLESAVKFGGEVAMRVEILSHRELGIVVLFLVLLAGTSPNVAEHIS
jgi:hypothetical protein